METMSHGQVVYQELMLAGNSVCSILPPLRSKTCNTRNEARRGCNWNDIVSGDQEWMQTKLHCESSHTGNGGSARKRDSMQKHLPSQSHSKRKQGSERWNAHRNMFRTKTHKKGSWGENASRRHTLDGK